MRTRSGVLIIAVVAAAAGMPGLGAQQRTAGGAKTDDILAELKENLVANGHFAAAGVIATTRAQEYGYALLIAVRRQPVQTSTRFVVVDEMHAYRGIFGSHVATEAGGACSATAIRALIKQLVAAEDGKRPLSDSKISEILGQQGIMVARRTIAKYRESLHIPPVNLRKSL